ncbi:protein nanos [Bactrocera neohumeralis]|uniref:protein nanos n=1 Tax=Bactrocera neohumeralis TaxID=98809 RepID=UPI002165D327|nr:protein nanos [Bactrocera neohumeralis]
MFGANLNIGNRMDYASSLELGLDLNYMSEVFLDTTNIISRCSPNLSPISTETSISQFSPNTVYAFSPSQLLSSTPASTVGCTISNSQTRPKSYGFFNANNENFGMKPPFLSSQNKDLKQDKYEIDQEPLAQQRHSQMYSEATLAQKQHKNEISKSLKMFAMLASYKYGNDSLNSGRGSPVCDIMDDFYCNGYVTDDPISFEEGKTLKATSHLETCNSSNKYFCSDFSSQCNWNFSTVNYESNNKGAVYPCINSNNVSVWKHYFDPNLWMMTPPPQNYNNGVHLQNQKINTAAVSITDTATVATVAAAANIAYNGQNIKKSQKRFGGSKLDKFSAVKHCVFCENNNEPEAVVKSHAVRDSLGRVLCPKLRTYICPICKASGDKAHTVKYCPQKPIITMEDAVKAESLRLAKNLYFKQGMNV